jgi:DNA polymerase I-like protein with 3'-5' exonuclease and polymerase domains
MNIFDALPDIQRKSALLRNLPDTPNTGWVAPTYWPRLNEAKAIGFDCETKENDFDNGPGWGRGQAYIAGFSISAYFSEREQPRWYFPVRHSVEREYNLPCTAAFAWLKHTLETSHIPKFGANLLYDFGNATDEGIWIKGDLYDCQFAEALLDETEKVALDELGVKYLGQGKDTNQLYQWCARAYGGEPTSSQRANIHRASPRLAGPYAEQDASMPREIMAKQIPLLEQQNLMPLFRMECDLIPLWAEMRRVGVRIDVDYAQRMYDDLKPQVIAAYDEIKQMSGIEFVDSGKQIQRIFDKLGLKYNTTAKGNASFKKEFLQGMEHPLGAKIMNVRQLEDLRETFVGKYLLEKNVKGRVHGQFHPLRAEAGGTRSGRVAASTPNLQNIPSRSKAGKLVRRAFVPDYGHMSWEKGDFSQIEYRELVHFAVGHGSDELRQEYATNPHTDYHVRTQRVVQANSGLYIPRKAEEAAAGNFRTGRLTIKEINFGLLYGMGKGKLARTAGLNAQQAEDVFAAYHSGAPYVASTMQWASDMAQRLGYTVDIYGRRSRFDLWEPTKWSNEGDREVALRYEWAIDKWGPNIKRAHSHKALNRILQGSAATQLKMAMWHCMREGVYSVIGVPRLTVHDENSHSVIDDSPEQQQAYAHMHRLFENAIPWMRCPVVFERERGPNWGEATPMIA